MNPNDLNIDQILEQQPEAASDSGYAPLTPTDSDPVTPELARQIDAACNRIAPVWPLDRFVAVNPFHGLVDQRFEQAAQTLRRIADARMYMPRSWYHEQLQSGRISDADLAEAARLCDSELTPQQLRDAAAAGRQGPTGGVPLLTALVDEMDADDWSSFVVERISHHCAAYFDMGQATWKRPWEGSSLYDSWRRFAQLDYSLTMMGQDGMRARVKALPESPRACIVSALGRLGIPDSAALDYMHAALMDIGGWAAWTRLLRWEQELQGGSDDTIVELLAIRLAWDVLLYEHKSTHSLRPRWREICARLGRGETGAGVGGEPGAEADDAGEVEQVLLTALEQGYQRRLIDQLTGDGATGKAAAGAEQRPKVQAAFCIDVRSEIIRRAFETVCPKAQTLGFAGFFGVPIEHVPLGATEPRSHMPVLLTPKYRVCSAVKEPDCGHDNADAQGQQAETALATQRRRTGILKSWKAFKLGASSCFSFVEAAGLLLYAPKIIADSFGWSRPVAAPDDLHLDYATSNRVGPTLDAPHHGACSHDHGQDHDHTHARADIGIPEEDRVPLAEGILKAMSMTSNYARLVLLVGHGSTVVNNPHATGLDCGACGGMTGEASARVGAALLNDTAVRRGLAARGIQIPADTWFIGALHDTCVDEVKLYDTEQLPLAYAEELAELKSWLKQAGEVTRLHRAARLGLDAKSGPAITANVRRRSRDWAQVRPEWALAGCAAFIAAPRSRTRGLDLGGRTFLHDYHWQQDEGFGVLELIMTAPMVVAGWINLQYYGSTTDNRRFGSGNKVLHNVVGGAIGVLEGNAGDLRVGLPMQSLHDGKQWMHEPMRLSVFLEAPQAAIDDIIARHELVRQMLDNGWLHLFRMDEAGDIQRRVPGTGWEPAGAEALPMAA
jgi:uncharacterized protein YbcC (UPF0753/DUF2309 family)